jgi:hypothetical protein
MTTARAEFGEIARPFVEVANLSVLLPVPPVIVLHPKTPLFQVTAFDAELQVVRPAPVNFEATLKEVVVALVVVPLAA